MELAGVSLPSRVTDPQDAADALRQIADCVQEMADHYSSLATDATCDKDTCEYYAEYDALEKENKELQAKIESLETALREAEETLAMLG